MSDNLPFANKSLGQHWLSDDVALEAMCDAVQVGPGDIVLEVGPGAGTLTKKLVKRATKVIAVEFDGLLAQQLPYRVPDEGLQVEQADILQYDLTGLTKGYKVVANIPYYLTSNLLRILCESRNPPSRMALLVQKEVAERVAAAPGSMSLLSVSVQFYCEVSLDMVVPAELFTPPPKVDSQILILDYTGPKFRGVDTKRFFQIVKAGFSERRKMLRSSLAGGLRLSKSEAELLLEKANILPTRRAQELTIKEWHQLYAVYNS